jgi:hypothetical protein
MSRLIAVFKFVLLDFVITEHEWREPEILPEQLQITS